MPRLPGHRWLVAIFIIIAICAKRVSAVDFVLGPTLATLKPLLSSLVSMPGEHGEVFRLLR